jgi:alkylation response protein AidB-like acyl-CoA dehydrogenase
MAAIAETVLDTLLVELDECSGDGQQQARMSPRAVADARKAGLFTLAMPPDPCPPLELMCILREVATVESGLAWSAANSVVLADVVARLADEPRVALMDRICAGPFGFSGIPGGRVTQTDHGFVLDGRWPFVTGVEDADLVVSTGVVGEQQPPDIRFFVVDPSQGQIGTNWQQVAGMRTSGSNSLELSGVEVDPNDAVRLFDAPVIDLPNYRLPMYMAQSLRARP